MRVIYYRNKDDRNENYFHKNNTFLFYSDSCNNYLSMKKLLFTHRVFNVNTRVGSVDENLS